MSENLFPGWPNATPFRRRGESVTFGPVDVARISPFYKMRDHLGRSLVQFLAWGDPRTAPAEGPLELPLLVTRDDGGRTPLQAVGLREEGGPPLLTADAWLKPGRYEVRCAGDARGWPFSIDPRSPAVLRAYCRHRGPARSYRDRLSAFSPEGDLVAWSVTVRVGACCRRDYAQEIAQVPRIPSLGLIEPLGRPVHFLDGRKRLTARPGEYVVQHPLTGARHPPAQSLPFSLRVVYVTEPVVSEILRRLDLPEGTAPLRLDPAPRRMTSPLRAAVDLFEDAISRGDLFGGATGSRAALENLVMTLLRHHPHSLAKPWRQRTTAAALDRRLQRAVAYLNHFPARPYDAAKLAEVACASRPVLWRLFRRHMHATPNGYLQKLRVEKAKRLLSHPGARVADVAAAVGYRNTRSFLRVFQAHAGRPTSFYRPG